MRILFIHRNFPGPFRHLAQSFGALPQCRTLFLSESGRKGDRLPGVRRLRLPLADPVETQDDGEREIVAALRRGARAANAMLRLRRDGFAPDVVYGAAGDGLSFYARDIFPRALNVARADWFYTRGENHTFFSRGAPRPPADFAPARVRNLCQYNALGDCDLAVTSSQWQKSQYPEMLGQRMHVLHDGVDTGYFSPVPGTRFAAEGCDLSGAPELATFSFRGSPAARGLPQFLRCLPRLLSLRPRCHALIMAGGPGAQGEAPLDDIRAGLDAVALPYADKKRVHLLEFRLDDYRRLLRASSAHVYLTAPFTLSAGLFEAMACGGLVIGSDTPPVREVVRHGENGFLCDFWDSEKLADIAAGVLERSPRLMPLREAARRTVLDDYDLAAQTARHRDLILSALAAKKSL